MRAKTRTTSLWFMLGSGILALMTGCAVMEVTVDVYKGPLANHRDVQVEQAVAAAIGAKPLLVQLRDQLEYGTPVLPASTGTKGSEQLFHRETLNRNLVDFRTANTNYRSGYVSTETYRFTNQLADRVNAVLSLYDDQVSKELSAVFRAGFAAFEDYEHAYAIFRPDTNSADIRLWAQLSRNMTTDNGSSPTNLASIKQRFTKAYEEFLTDPRRDQSKILVILTNLPDGREFDGIRLESVPAGSNAQFDLLATNLVHRHAEFLYGTNSTRPRAAFVAQVQLIAKSFHRTRAALDHLLVSSLNALALLSREGAKDGEPNRRLIGNVAELVVSILQHALLNDLCTNQLQWPVGSSAAAHGSQVVSLSRQLTNTTGGLLTPASLARVLQEEPESISLVLLQLHVLAKSLADHPSVVKSNQEITKFRHGLVRGPTADIRELRPGEIASALYSAANVVANGYDRGRLLMGIETLVEQYLETFVSVMDKQHLREERRALLLNALIGFSEKLRTLSNFSALAGGDSGGFREYVPVLQAVGNSILIQIDEIRQQTQHQHKLRGAGGNEMAAITNSGLITSAQVLSNANAILGEPGSNDVHQVHERLLSLLRYEYAAAVREGGTNIARAQQLQQVIDVIGEIHNDSVYLRPAAAYLRNSYPATVLQGDSSTVGWKNMVAEHMLRGTPLLNLFPRLVDFGGGRKTHRLQRDIDKQYWQNINRVRVAGSGDANYVVAKDDVGNWYVKSYSVNASNIYASAAGLAQFAMSGTLSTDIPTDITKASKESSEQGSNALTAAIHRQLASTGKSYDTAVITLIDEFQSKTTNRLAAFTNSWASIITNQAEWVACLENYTNAFDTHLRPVLGAMKPQDGKTLLDGLASLRRFYRAVEGNKPMLGKGDALTKVEKEWRSAVIPVLQEVCEKYERLQREHKAALETLAGIQ